MRQRTYSIHRQAAGLTLIEVLVAMLIVSVGLLGVAGLHMRSLQSNYDALMRTHATSLANDIADRMRANRSAVTPKGVYDEIAYGDKPSVGTNPPQALRDAKEWKDALEAQLPAGDGDVEVNGDTGVVTIRVSWGERTGRVEFETQTVI
jgi:type IV pilus assembly protein PilV